MHLAILGGVLRPSAALFLVIFSLTSCRNGLESKDKVQGAIVQRLQTSSGLDLKSLDVTTTDVSFDKNLAYATVAFHPKGDANVTSGMTMKYTLEQRDGKWAIVKVGNSQGHGSPGNGSQGNGSTGQGAPGGSGLPAGHPPVDGAMPSDRVAPSNPPASAPRAGTPNGQVR